MRHCANCGFNVESTDIFCPSCGHHVGSAAANPPSATALPISQRPTVRFDERRIFLGAPLPSDLIAPPATDEFLQPPNTQAFADVPASGVEPQPTVRPGDDAHLTLTGGDQIGESASMPPGMRALVQGTMCPYCLFGVEESLTACPSCAEAYHDECWIRFGGCVHSHCDRWRLGAGRRAQ